MSPGAGSSGKPGSEDPRPASRWLAPSAFLDRCAAEPFRLFFPLGVLASLVGVLLWPAYFAGWTPPSTPWPAELHARWMVGGFGGCFVVGFLGTAGPRLLGADRWCRFELLLHAVMALAMMACLTLGRVATADGLFGFWLLGVLVSLLLRLLVGRRDVPPPGFPVAVIGVAGAALAGFALAVDPLVALPQPVLRLARLLYFQGLLWLPVLGVAPYLLPRFFGCRSTHSFEAATSLPDGWLRAFAISLTAGALLVASFVVEAWHGLRLGQALRALVVLAALAATVPGLVRLRATNGLGWALRLVPLGAVAGWMLAAWLTPLRAGMLHLMFVSGAGMILLAVAARVILGHGSRHDRLGTRMRWCHGLWAMVLLAATTRVIADLIPSIRVSHYIYAALMWLVAVAFWAWKLRRELRAPAAAPLMPAGSRCPRRRRMAVRSGWEARPG